MQHVERRQRGRRGGGAALAAAALAIGGGAAVGRGAGGGARRRGVGGRGGGGLGADRLGETLAVELHAVDGEDQVARPEPPLARGHAARLDLHHGVVRRHDEAEAVLVAADAQGKLLGALARGEALVRQRQHEPEQPREGGVERPAGEHAERDGAVLGHAALGGGAQRAQDLAARAGRVGAWRARAGGG